MFVGSVGESVFTADRYRRQRNEHEQKLYLLNYKYEIKTIEKSVSAVKFQLVL